MTTTGSGRQPAADHPTASGGSAEYADPSNQSPPMAINRSALAAGDLVRWKPRLRLTYTVNDPQPVGPHNLIMCERTTPSGRTVWLLAALDQLERVRG